MRPPLALITASVLWLYLSATLPAAPPEPFDPFGKNNEAAPAKPQAKDGQAPDKALASKQPTHTDRIDFDVSIDPPKAKRGAIVRIKIEALLRPGFHTYPATQITVDEPPGILSMVTIETPAGIKPVPGL